MHKCKCQGWWSQVGWGRQSMHNLWLSFNQRSISGAGRDVVANFALEGFLRPDGHIELLKKYEKAHQVVYLGKYDGEGTYAGTWALSGYRGEWAIKVERHASRNPRDIQEILPHPDPGGV